MGPPRLAGAGPIPPGDRVQLVNVSSSHGDSSTKVAKAFDGSGGGGDGTGDLKMIELQLLVGRVVGLDMEGVFRLMVGFL